MSWNGAAATLSSSACGIGDCITQDPISGGRRRNFDCFEDQSMQGSLPQTFPGNIATMSWYGDAATQSSRACRIGGMITHDLISGARKRDFDVFADQRVQGSSPQTFPGNSANQNGGGAASMGHSANKNGGGPASMAAVSIPGSPASVSAAGQQQPKVPESKRPRGFIEKLPEKSSAKYSDMLARIAPFALEINSDLGPHTIFSFGKMQAARKQLEDRCINGQFRDTFKRPDGGFYSAAQIWEILTEGVQSWQDASGNRRKTGDANLPHTALGDTLDKLVAAKQVVAAKAAAMAEVERKKTEYKVSMCSVQEHHMNGVERQHRSPKLLTQLLKIFNERESEVARTFEENHGRAPTTNHILEMVFEDRDEEDVKMIRDWFVEKQASDIRAMRRCAARWGGNVGETESDSDNGSSAGASESSSKHVSRGKGPCKGPRRKAAPTNTAPTNTLPDFGDFAKDLNAQMERQREMNESFLSQWATLQNKKLELKAAAQEKEAAMKEKEVAMKEKEAVMKEKESAMRMMQALLGTGDLSPNARQKLVQSMAKQMCGI